MKKQTILATATLATAFSFSVATAQEATTTPVGYKKETIAGNAFNLLGVTLHEPTLVSGTFESADGSSVTDDDVDFDTIVTGSDIYILEITTPDTNSPTGFDTTAGLIAELVNTGADDNVDGNTLNVNLPGVTAGATYKIRKASTVSSIFGAANESGLAATTSPDFSSADLVYVPDGAAFTRVFYLDAGVNSGWLTSSFTPANNLPIVYTDAVLVQRKGSTPTTLTVTGEVKESPTSVALNAGFNYVGVSFPVGSTLGNSGLENSLTATTTPDFTNADLVYVPDGSGGYDRYFYLEAGENSDWFSTAFVPAGTTPLTSGVIIQRRAGSTDAVITPNY